MRRMGDLVSSACAVASTGVTTDVGFGVGDEEAVTIASGVEAETTAAVEVKVEGGAATLCDAPGDGVTAD